MSWTYDGFGNRLSQNVTKGTAPVVSLSISAATNRITTPGFAYDAAGHMTQWPGGTVTLGADYDVERRLSVVKQDGVNLWRYLYDARNRRVRRADVSGNPPKYEVYGPGGELLGVYGGYWYWSGGQWNYVFRMEEERIYFAGRVAARLDETGSPNFGRMDRLGSVKAWQRYPFGEGNESSTNDEYATYPIDRSTGHYYAWNRFYSATWGRFSSPDPYVMSGGLTNPQGWNRYSSVANDPVNRYDPRGLQDEIPTYTVNVYAPFPTAALSGAEGDSAEMEEVADLPSVVETGGEPVGGGSIDPFIQRWNGLSEDCRSGLNDAISVGTMMSMSVAIRARLAALDRALAARQSLEQAVRETTTQWTMLAAIGIRETGFRNINQPNGNGVGVFQIDIGQNPSMSRENASDVSWAARWAANTLAANRALLAARFPKLTFDQLLQATAASWNLGVGGISGNPETIDVGSTGGNYGRNIIRLMDCFR